MADNGFKINKSINLTPQASAPSNPLDGDMYFNSVSKSFSVYHDGAWANMDSVGAVAVATNLTSTQLTPSAVQNAVVKITGTGASTLHGLTASHSGKRLALYNSTDSTMILKHQSATELTSNNRIVTPTAGDMNLVAGEIVEFIYDVVAARWLLVSVGSGAGAYAVATTGAVGLVRLNAAAVAPSTPDVAVIDSANKVVATGLTRGALAAGVVTIGDGANDNSVTIGKTGATITLAATASMPLGFSAAYASSVVVAAGFPEAFHVSTSGASGVAIAGAHSGSGYALQLTQTGTCSPLRIVPQAATPVAGLAEGSMYYNSTDDSLRVYWHNATSATGRFQQINAVRAWCSFNVSAGSAPAATQSENVTVTRDTASNIFILTFDVPVLSAQYCPVVSCSNAASGTYANMGFVLRSHTRTTSSYSFSLLRTSDGAVVDIDHADFGASINVAIYSN